jgi:hypothetical protein
MPSFPDLLAALGLAPKNLPQAKEAIDGAKATLDSVAALFTAAGLNLEQMLAAGPDALKAHLESLDNAEELATALDEAGRLGEQLTVAEAKLVASAAQLDSHAAIFAAIGFKPAGAALPEVIKGAFEAHVSKATTLALAKTGHPPAHVPAADAAPAAAQPTLAELHAQWKAMKPSPERLNFFSQHEAAITSFERNHA